jgi:AP-1-like factor
MEPLTPNTSAFLSYLSSTMGKEEDDSIYSNANYDSTKNLNPSSLPPSAFFPLPGRDTPEDTPPSSIEASQSPEKITQDHRKLSAYSADDSDSPSSKPKVSKATHKRKGGAGHKEEDEDEEDGMPHRLSH